MSRVELLNANFHDFTLQSTVDALSEAVRRGERGWLATVNVAILMGMRDDPDLQRFTDKARWVVADGQPIVWLSRLLRRPLPERVTGVDLIEQVCARAHRDGDGVFFLGASSRVISAAAHNLLSRYPGLRLHYDDGYFDHVGAADRVRAVAASDASYLFVGMGVPRQERFIEEHWDRLGTNVAVGVGGSFEVMGGALDRAPEWAQKSGLEWVFRLIQEPRRLWRRYLVTGAQFGLLSSHALSRHALRRRP